MPALYIHRTQVIRDPADDLAPISAMQAISSHRTNDKVRQVLWSPMTPISALVMRWRHSKWPTRANEISRYFQVLALKVPVPYIYDFHALFPPLQWRHNGRDGVWNHQPLDCLFSRLFRCRSKYTSKLGVTGLCEGNSPVTGEFPAQ